MRTVDRLEEIARRVMAEGRPYLRRGDGGYHISLGGDVWYYGMRWGRVRLEADRWGNMWLDVDARPRDRWARGSWRLWNRSIHYGRGAWCVELRVKLLQGWHPQWGSYSWPAERIEP